MDCAEIRNASGKDYMLRFLPYLELPDGTPVESVIGYDPRRGYGYGRWEEFYQSVNDARERMAFLIATGAVEDATLHRSTGAGICTVVIDEWRACDAAGAEG